MAALSVGDLFSNRPSSRQRPTSEYANHGLATDNAQTLVQAFENLIVPIIHAYAPAPVPAINDASRSGNLKAEAEQLLGALRTFVAALVRSQLAVSDRKEGDTSRESAVREERDKPRIVQPSVDGTIVASKRHTPDFEERPLLKLVLEEAHYYVFNRMPIRLLAFKKDGSGIELMERSAIWRSISATIENDLSESGLTDALQRQANSTESQMSEERKREVWIKQLVAKYGRYAILSHTWLHGKPGEVTYADWQSGEVDTDSPGYRKLANFCKVAATDYKLSFGWMDTVCINKNSSSELDESIRSMFRWYLNSDTCITYLAETTTLRHMRDDSWFTRGWTLQELIAPRRIKFYGADWCQISSGLIDDKANHFILEEICAATTITRKELNRDILWTVPISRRMQWAAKRRVTREEDMAYSLMGIFSVSISTAYGEGAERAFTRLVKEILTTRTVNVLDILNRGRGDEYRYRLTLERTSVLIPSSPREYLWRVDRDIHWYTPTTPITLTHLGLHVPVLLMLGASIDPDTPDNFRPIGNYYATAKDVTMFTTSGILHHDYHLLEMASHRENLTHRRVFAFFGVLNLLETADTVELPGQSACFAVPLKIHPPPTTAGSLPKEFRATPIPTKCAVVFDLKQFMTDSFIIPKTELRRHGMTLRTLYL